MSPDLCGDLFSAALGHLVSSCPKGVSLPLPKGDFGNQNQTSQSGLSYKRWVSTHHHGDSVNSTLNNKLTPTGGFKLLVGSSSRAPASKVQFAIVLAGVICSGGIFLLTDRHWLRLFQEGCSEGYSLLLEQLDQSILSSLANAMNLSSSI